MSVAINVNQEVKEMKKYKKPEARKASFDTVISFMC